MDLADEIVITIGIGGIIIALLRLLWKNKKKFKNIANMLRVDKDKKVDKLIKQGIKLIEVDFKLLIERELRGATYEKGLNVIKELKQRIDRHKEELDKMEGEMQDGS